MNSTMRTIKCLVIFGVWLFTGVGVGSIRVPTSWNEESGNIRNFHYGVNGNHRFRRLNERQGLRETPLERRMFVENGQGSPFSETLIYNPLQPNSPGTVFAEPRTKQMMILNQNGLYILPQSNPETTPLAIQAQTNLPPLLNPRYSDNNYQRTSGQIPLEQLKDKAQYFKHQKLSATQKQNEPADKYQSLPSDVVRIKPTLLGVPSIDNYRQLKEAQMRQAIRSQITPRPNSGVHREYPKASTASLFNTYMPKKQSQLPSGQSLNHHIPQNHKFIVSATEEDATLSPLGFQFKPDVESEEFTTKKEPVFFVTEGYRNVLVQGPDKKKKYVGGQMQKKDESRKILRKAKAEVDDDEESEKEEEKPPRKRKVTKIYRIHGNNDKAKEVGGTSKNLVQSEWKKPRRYFQSPHGYTGLTDPLIKNHRDDKLFEPNENHESERDDNEEDLVDDRENERRSSQRDRFDKSYRDDQLDEPKDDEDTEKVDEDDEEAADNDQENEQEDDDKAKGTLETDPKDPKNNTDDTKPENTIPEPTETEDDDEEEADEEDDEETEDEEAENEDNQEKQVPYSEHADPKPIPTKPIYPGEGQWAKRGRKHRPYISQHRFLKPVEDEQKPDGHDVFEELENFFDTQKDQFGTNFGEKVEQPVSTVPSTPISNYIQAVKSPNPVNPLVIYDPFNESSNQNSRKITNEFSNNKAANPTGGYIHRGVGTNVKQGDSKSENSDNIKEDTNHDTEGENEEESDGEEESEEAAEEFVPQRLYTQVRKSENVEHEPHNPLEHGRLREVIKDSKVQTVYSEEGFEDAAYDHAGHEKKAEQDQGYSAFEREKEEPAKSKQVKAEDSDSDGGQSKKVAVSDAPGEPLLDSVASDSIYPSHPKHNNIDNTESIKTVKIPKLSNTNNFIKTQELKTTQVKDKNNGDVQLEIQSEVKVIVQPNNSTKAHRYVKIYPKVLKDISMKSDEDDDDDEESDEEPDKPLNTTKTSPAEDVVKVIDNLGHSAVNLNESQKISGENNRTNDENYLKIYQDINNLAVSDASTTESSTVSDIEILTKKSRLVSTEKPKVVVKVLDEDGALKKITDQFSKIGYELSRKKRSSGSDFEGVDIDTEFVDKITHTFAPPKPSGIDVEKYPYYTMPDINEDSPLRYAENMDNIPVKQDGELSFYQMADKLACPDLPQSIDPIPEHVKNADKQAEEAGEESDDEDDEESDEDEEEEEDSEVEHPSTPKTPRVQIGDKIDCLKIRYFGDNPLDSPFFQEETVGPVKPLFKELDRKAKEIKNIRNQDSTFKSTETVDNVSKANEIFDQTNKKDERKFETDVKDKIFNALNKSAINLKVNTLLSIEDKEAAALSTNRRELKLPETENMVASESKPTPSPLVTLITTPKYTIQLTPKNIYDQIKLLDHLPEDDPEEEAETTTKRLEETTVKEKIKTTTENVKKQEETVGKNDGKEESSRRQQKVLLQENDNVEERKNSDEDVLEPEALRRRKKRPRRPIYQIFDVNRFLTTTPFSIINTASSTVLPKYKVLSEVFYKDEIKPNEQLTVFADILNNIKNSSHLDTVPIQSASNFAEPSAVTLSSLEEATVIPKTTTPSNVRVKKYQTDSSNQQNSYEGDLTPPKSDVERPYNDNIPVSYNVQKHYHTKETPINTNNQRQHGSTATSTNSVVKPKQKITSYNPTSSTPKTKLSTRKMKYRRRKPTISTTSTTLRTTTNIHVPNQNTPSNHQPYVIDFIEDTAKVIGLVPPKNFLYRTIVVDGDDDQDVRDTNEVPEQIYEYKTILPSTITEPIPIKSPAPVTEANDELPPKRPLNKYYFLGLKPPAHHRARPYSEFANNNVQVNDNLLRRRVAHIGLARAKRNAIRPAYADLSRNRGRQNEGLERTSTPADDIDDYVPHRPRNYHYDEKTGKIVYHSKPAESKEEEEVEYEEIDIPDTPGIYLERAEDATHPTPEKVTTKELLATATPPPEGQGLLDFVVKLKNNPSYVYIPDPTTPKPGSIESTTEALVTVDPKSTNPPEFLSILSKVKSDKNYKAIDDPKESKSKSKSTTPEPESEEEYVDDDDEEEEGLPGKNHSRPTRQTNLKIFDIGDFLPKIQTPISSNIPTNFFQKNVVEKIFPKLRYMTLFDIAKERYKQTDLYKFFNKNVQNSPGGQTQDLGNVQIFDIGDYLPKVKPITPKTRIDYSKYQTIERPHTRHNISSRYHEEDKSSDEREEVVSRPPFNPAEQPTAEETLVRKPVFVEVKESVDRIIDSEKAVGHHNKEKEAIPSTSTEKIVQFRRGTRPSTQKTTADNLEPTEPVATRRSSNRRKPLPTGFKSTRRPTSTTEVTEPTEKIQRVYPEYHSTERSYSDVHDKAKRVYRRRPVRIRYTTERHEEDDETIDKIMRRSLDTDSDDVSNEFQKEYLDESNVEEGYEDEKEDIINNDENDRELESEEKEVEDKTVSETKKKEIVEQNPKDVEIINKNYDKTQKHGGNYRRENEEEEIQSDEENNSPENNENQSDQSGETESRSAEKDTQEVATDNTSKKNKVDIINKNYDKTKKHGGNYKKEDEEDTDGAVVETDGDEKVIGEKNLAKIVTSLEVDQTLLSTNKHGNKKLIDLNYDETEEDEYIDVAEDAVKEDLQGANNEDSKNSGEIVAGNKNLDVDIVNKNYDKTKKHGGNYKSQEDAVVDELLERKEQTQQNQRIQYATPRKLKPNKRKFQSNEDATENPNEKQEENQLKRRKLRIRLPSTTENPKKIPRLSDIAPKPDHFYSDPQLPKQVNKLVSERTPVELASEELEQVAEEGDLANKEEENPIRRQAKISRIFNQINGAQGVRDSNVSSEGEKTIPTKKPLFIRDPSKRLYFYAPI